MTQRSDTVSFRFLTFPLQVPRADSRCLFLALQDVCYNRESGTLLSAVKARVEGILQHNRLGQGRDLFPGPGYASRR